MSRTYTYLAGVIGGVCLYAVIEHVISTEPTVRNDVIQGFFVGIGLGLVTAAVFARIKATTVNGWITVYGAGVPGSSMLFRAACLLIFPGPVNVPQEAMYWWANVDGRGHTLSGAHDYVLRFPAGQLPPNDAFWSLTMGDTRNRFVPNPINRYSVSDRTGLVPNADGSVDIYIQTAAPAGREANWLPAPSGNFILWLRAYMPRAAILSGAYRVPPVVEAT